LKVLIASAPHADTFGYSMPPPGLLRLGGAALRAGLEVALDDLSYRWTAGDLGDERAGTLAERAAAHLLARGPVDLLGLSVMGATVPIAVAILERLRPALPGATFALGGPGVHGTGDELLRRFPWIDLVVRGEAEETLPELTRALERGEDLRAIEGLTLRGADGTVERTPDRAPLRDLGDLPDYAWDLLPSIADYKALRGEEDGLVPLDSGRGCVYDCSFCSIGRTWSRRSRALPAARLADEIEGLRAIPAARRAYLCHDIFGADRRHAMALCAELVRRSVDVPWEVRARVDHLDDELLAAMAGAGCDRVLLGIESGAPEVRRRNQKGMRDDVDVLARVRACVDAGVTPILSLILGLPGEGDAELERSLDLCARAALSGGVQVSLHLVNPQPGCALGDEFGPEARPSDTVPPDMALGAGESPEERALIDAHPDLFSTWALLPMAPERLDELVFLKDELGALLMRYPRTFHALRFAGGGESASDALALAREWRADGRTFETFARERSRGGPRQGVVDALLDWEGSLVRVGARGRLAPIPGRWRVGGEVLRAPFDVVDATVRMVEGAPPPLDDHAAEPRAFAVAVAPVLPGALPGIRTLRIGAGAADLAARLQDPRAADADRRALERSLDPEHPALAALVAAGLLVPPAQAESSAPA